MENKKQKAICNQQHNQKQQTNKNFKYNNNNYVCGHK